MFLLEIMVSLKIENLELLNRAWTEALFFLLAAAPRLTGKHESKRHQVSRG